ncbi:MAG: TIGR00266 family protein [Candidatus Methanophagaceae archaeon]|nr:MAG: TIGR00266 family protein [Methanophagales archaeon]
MEYEIIGDNLQMVVVKISSGEMVYGEAGAMIYMSENMEMNAKAKGGFLKGVMRKFAGESFFMTEFSPKGYGFVAFAGNAPGRIKAIELRGNEFIAMNDAFLCAQEGVELEIKAALSAKQRGGLLFGGGRPFILERLGGRGSAFIHACGDFVEIDLAHGEVVKVDTGSIVGFESSVSYDIVRAGNVKTMLFSGEHSYLTTLTGPGHVILQSMTMPNLAAALRPFLPSSSGTSEGSVE